MATDNNKQTLPSTRQRKNEHLKLSLTDNVSFREKTNGFEKYDFIHYAITEVDLSKIDLKTKFFSKKINYPFLISCMTGGTTEAENINAQLAVAASELNIALGVGSQRHALENSDNHKSFELIRQKAPSVPILGNIGASQIVRMNSFSSVRKLADLIEADAMVVHVNPLQELMQKEGQPDFQGLLKKIERLINELKVPLIVKEVGAGISPKAAKKLLDAGVKGIDVAGAGGTSWSGIEILRNNGNNSNPFWDWGLPTSYCIKNIIPLKNKYNFMLIGSGGINNSFDAAKALALGADIAASARIILLELNKNGIDGVKKLIENWFDEVKKIMFLTGSQTIKDLKKNKLIEKELLH